MNRRRQLSIAAPGATEEEAAAVVAALERFMRETAPPPAPSHQRRTPWQQAALREGVARQPELPPPRGCEAHLTTPIWRHVTVMGVAAPRTSHSVL